MNAFLARSRALLLLVLAPALLGEGRFAGERGPRPDWSRPLEEMRDVVGVVSSTERIDVYWLHTNELAEPVRSILYRTGISADGTARLGTTRVHDFESQVSARVSGSGANVQVIWSGLEGIEISPIEGDALKYPQGKRIEFGHFPRLVCHADECVAAYDLSSVQTAVILDRDANVISGPFALPYGYHPLTILFDERGLFFVRHDSTALRAALLRRDGSVQWDVKIASASPSSFLTAEPGVTTRGYDYVVAFAEFRTSPDELHTVTISSSGSVSAPKRLMQVEEHPQLQKNYSGASMAFSGARFLLSGYYVIGTPFLMTLDASLTQIGPLVRSDALPYAYPHPDVSSFVIVWAAPSPFVTILRADDSMSAPVAIAPPPPRRRAVR